jgi:hypothetical protein
MIREEIQKLRNERNSERKRCETMTNNIDKMLKNLNDDSGDSLVNWESLNETEIGEIYYVNKDVFFIPVEKSEDKLSFITVCEKSGEFGIQAHDIDEYCKVLKGQLIEKMQNYKIVNVGETITYPAYLKHKPSGGDGGLNVYWVTFKK